MAKSQRKGGIHKNRRVCGDLSTSESPELRATVCSRVQFVASLSRLRKSTTPFHPSTEVQRAVREGACSIHTEHSPVCEGWGIALAWQDGASMIYPPPWMKQGAGPAEDAGRETIQEGVLRTFAASSTSCGRIDHACVSAAKQGGEVRTLEFARVEKGLVAWEKSKNGAL